MTTRARPMADLDRFDASGDYLVIGSDAAVRSVEASLSRARFSVSTTWAPSAVLAVVRTGVDGTSGLVFLAFVCSATLCVVGTVGSPRRAAVRRLSGRRLTDHLGAESTGALPAIVVAGGLFAVAVLGLAVWNGLAQAGSFLQAAALAWGAAFAAVLAVHLAAATLAFRSSPARAVRGDRPGGAAVTVAQIARFPAAVLLVVATFDLVGSIAVVREGGADRELRAAGDTVQLWVTGDPAGDVTGAAYWDALGALAGDALASGSAFVSAAVEVPNGPRNAVVVAFVSDEYLRRHPVVVNGGATLDPGDGVQVAIPARLGARRDRIVEQIVDWNLKDASPEIRAGVRTAELAPGQDLYLHPGDDHAPTWLADPVVVAVGSPAEAFSHDQLGAWLSSGDVVFTSETAARRSLRGSPVASEISAVVAVGQEAAERSSRAAAARVHLLTWVGAVTASVLVLVQGTRAQRRRSAQPVFARFVAGWSPVAIDRRLLAFEATVFLVTLGAAFQLWWERRPDPQVFGATLDPVSAASAGAFGVAAGSALLVAGLGVVVVHRSRTVVIAAHGKDR